MLGDLVAACLRVTPTTAAGAISAARNRDGSPAAPPPLVVRALLLLRNLALAPSTGQVCYPACFEAVLCGVYLHQMRAFSLLSFLVC